jgi:hypothetical protein
MFRSSVRLVLRFLISSLVQVTGEPVGEVRAVSGMHERKAEMARFADAFIALPGMVVCSVQYAANFFDGHGVPKFDTLSLGFTLQAATELWKRCLRSSPGRN